MKKLSNIFFLFAICAFTISSCGDKEEDQSIQLGVTASYEDSPFEMNKVYKNHLDQYIKYEGLKFYISNISLQKDNDEILDLTDAILYDFTKPETFDFDIPTGKYKKINFSLGLNENQNASDPVTFDPEHPLSYAQNTHWDWASKYRFIMIDGRIDPVSDQFSQGDSRTFSYHTGFDELYRELSIDLSFEIVEEQEVSVNLNLEIEKLFNNSTNIDMFETNTSHSLTQVAREITDNMSEAFEVSLD